MSGRRRVSVEIQLALLNTVANSFLLQSSVVPPKDQTRLKIEKMEAEREERRRAMMVVRQS